MPERSPRSNGRVLVVGDWLAAPCFMPPWVRRSRYQRECLEALLTGERTNYTAIWGRLQTPVRRELRLFSERFDHDQNDDHDHQHRRHFVPDPVEARP